MQKTLKNLALVLLIGAGLFVVSFLLHALNALISSINEFTHIDWSDAVHIFYALVFFLRSMFVSLTPLLGAVVVASIPVGLLLWKKRKTKDTEETCTQDCKENLLKFVQLILLVIAAVFAVYFVLDTLLFFLYEIFWIVIRCMYYDLEWTVPLNEIFNALLNRSYILFFALIFGAIALLLRPIKKKVSQKETETATAEETEEKPE